MDPCPFVRVIVGNLLLQVPAGAAATAAAPCFCKIKLRGFPPQFAMVPNVSPDSLPADGSVGRTLHAQNFPPLAATFHLNKAEMEKLAVKSFFRSKGIAVTVSIYSERASCWVKSGKLLGKVTVPLNLAGVENKPVLFHNGWVNLGATRFNLNVRSEPDPRFVFQFGGEPQCSPQVFQIQGTIQQPVFTCKFGFRSNLDQNQRARLEPSFSRVWSFGSGRERAGKERKGWSVTVHDLSGSPVAAASMVTPFVASPGTDRVSRSNPGAWLILRPGDSTWKPWGRLEVWRERGGDGLGFRFELIPEYGSSAAVVLAETAISSGRGGKFVIDLGANGKSTPGSAASTPAVSPRSSADYGYGHWPYSVHRGFVMSATVAGEGRRSRSNGGGIDEKPRVEISVQHVNCTEDAAAFVALSAAVHLSKEACRPFSQKLRKELCPPPGILV